MKKQQDKRGDHDVVVSALAMAFGTGTSRILGLVRDQLFFAFFSLTITHAWTAAFRLPNMFRRLLGEGSLSVSFVPVFVETLEKDASGERSRRLVAGFSSLMLVFLTVLTTLGVIFAPQILDLLLSDKFKEIPGKFELAVYMAQIMFSFIFLMSFFALFMSILNSVGKFALAGFAPTLWNVAMIAANFFPKEYQRIEGEALAWGVVIGGFLQMGILIPALIKAGFLPRGFNFNWKNPDVVKVLRGMGPGLIGLGLLQITTIVNMRFASELGEGPISYIYLADRLLELPLSLVSVSLGTALLPTLSALWTRGDVKKMTDTANYYLRVNLLVAVPAAIGLYVLAAPIIEILFQRGKFSGEDVVQTVGILKIMAFIMISASCARILVPSFYAIKDTKTPAIVSAICLVVHVLLAPRLMNLYGLDGLIASTLVSASLNVALLIFFYSRKIGAFGFGKVLVAVSKFLVAGAGMYVVIQVYPLFISYFGVSLFGKLISLFGTIALGMATYGGICLAFKTPEFKDTFDRVVGKLNRKLKR